MAIEIDLRIPPCGPATEVAEFAAQCEEAGFDGVGILDSQMLERDVFVSMAFAAQATKRIRISSAVINPVTRHISVLASAAKTVAELAPGHVTVEALPIKLQAGGQPLDDRNQSRSMRFARCRESN